GSDDDAVRPQEIGHGGALAQKLGVGGDANVECATLAGDRLAHAPCGAEHHRGHYDDKSAALQMRRNPLRRTEHVAEVDTAAWTRGRADSDEDDIRVRHTLSQSRCETKVACRHGLAHRILKPRLVNRGIEAPEA